MIVINKMDDVKLEGLVQEKLLVQTMECTKHSIAGEEMLGKTLFTRVKMCRVNMKALDTSTREYIVAATKFEELNGYATELRNLTIKNDEWRESVIKGIEDLSVTVEAVKNYDIANEYNKTMESRGW